LIKIILKRHADVI